MSKNENSTKACGRKERGGGVTGASEVTPSHCNKKVLYKGTHPPEPFASKKVLYKGTHPPSVALVETESATRL